MLSLIVVIFRDFKMCVPTLAAILLAAILFLAAILSEDWIISQKRDVLTAKICMVCNGYDCEVFCSNVLTLLILNTSIKIGITVTLY